MNSKSNDCMLTTYDNIFNPFTEFESWFKQDLILGHNCCGLLAKYAAISPVFSDELNEEETERAIDEIVEDFPMIYRKVTPADFANVNV